MTEIQKKALLYLVIAIVGLLTFHIVLCSTILLLLNRTFKQNPTHKLWLCGLLLFFGVLMLPGNDNLLDAPLFVPTYIFSEYPKGWTSTLIYLIKVFCETVMYSFLAVATWETYVVANPKYKKKETKEKEKVFQQSPLNQWLVKQAEQKATKYHDLNGVLVGIDIATRKPIVLESEELNMHVFLAGTTGAGKTTTIETFVDAAARSKKPIIMIDGKGDYKFALMANYYAREHRIPFRYFSLTESEHVWHYDPLAYGNYTELKDRLIAMGDWGSEPFFKGRGARYLQIETKILTECGIKCDLDNVIKYMEPSALTMLARKLPDKKQAEAYMSQIENFDAQHIQSTVDQIAIFTESYIGKLFKEQPGRTIQLFDALQEGGITLFSLDSMRYPELARAIGKLILTDFKSAAAMHRDASGKPVSAIFDEFGVYASTQVVDFINKSRSAGFEALIATQSIADIDIVDPYLSKQIIQNCNTVIIQRQNDSDDAERLASTIGTEDTAGMTYQTESGLLFDARTGRGSMRITKEFVVHPDEIKRLRTGEAIIMRKLPEFQVHRTNVIHLGRRADRLESSARTMKQKERQESENCVIPEDEDWFVLSKKRQKGK